MTYNVRVQRKELLIKHDASGLTFRFFYDRREPSKLHIEARWGMSTDQAIETFFAASKDVVWIDTKRCYETKTSTHTLAWLWDIFNVQVMVITCVPQED